MSIFGPGVGGGLLAAAGGLNGLGQGITENAKQQQKVDLETKLSDLSQKREEAITRLQGQQQSSLEEQRAGHEDVRTEKEIAGRSNVAHFEVGEKESEAQKARDFEATQNKAKLTSEEKRTERTAESRENVATTRNQRVSASSGKMWQVHNITEGGGIDPNTHMPTPQKQTQVLFNTHTGRQYVAAGDRLLPYDASKGGMAPPESVKRAPAADVQDLIKDPLGKIPEGFQNAGMDKATAFEQTHGYLPTQWMPAAQQADQQQQSSSSTSVKLPGRWAPGFVRPGAQVTPGPSFGGGGNSDQDSEDDQNADADAATVQ